MSVTVQFYYLIYLISGSVSCMDGNICSVTSPEKPIVAKERFGEIFCYLNVLEVHHPSGIHKIVAILVSSPLFAYMFTISLLQKIKILRQNILVPPPGDNTD